MYIYIYNMFANASKHVDKFIFSYTCQNMTFPWHYFRQCVSKHAVKLTLHWFSQQLSRISMARSSKCLKGNFWAHLCLCPQPNPQIKKKGNELFRFSKFSTSPLRRKAQWGARVFSPSFQRAPIVFETEGVSPRRFFLLLQWHPWWSPSGHFCFFLPFGWGPTFGVDRITGFLRQFRCWTVSKK